MSDIFYRDTTDGITWTIERQPSGCTDPAVVRFRKSSRLRTLLDQSARWTSRGWDTTRWTPHPPVVPQRLIELVVDHMLSLETKS